MDDLPEIIQKICEHTKLKEAEVRRMVEEKMAELSGLVSEEGAAYIVGREMGVSLVKETSRRLKIKNVTTGLRSVDMVAKIVKISDTRDFTTKTGKVGKVLNVFLGDETGFIRMSLWDAEIERFQLLQLGVGDVIRITKGFTKPDNLGNPELRVGFGRLDKADEAITAAPMKEMERVSSASRKWVAELTEGEFAEVRATLLQVFQRQNPLYEVCPQCGSRLGEEKGKFLCKQHGAVEPEFQMVATGILDDGTANIRAAFFRDMAAKVFGKEPAEIRKLVKDGKVEELYQQATAVGKDWIFRGRVKMNQMGDALEMMVNDIEAPKLEKEIERLMG